jgi:glycosyltransferase involved in cell wall biosynthesis
VEPESTSSFADALENAADNRKDLAQMGANARQLAKTEFDRKVLADNWVEFVLGKSI